MPRPHAKSPKLRIHDGRNVVEAAGKQLHCGQADSLKAEEKHISQRSSGKTDFQLACVEWTFFGPEKCCKNRNLFDTFLQEEPATFRQKHRQSKASWKRSVPSKSIAGRPTRGFNFGKEPVNIFTKDLRADYVMANPPFNMKESWDGKLEGAPRWE